MAGKYIYDAFISYRHTEPDKFVAENLHKQMEAFRLPKSAAAKKAGRTRIDRVFRDKDELPLTSNLEDPIMKALQNSEFLIVICSPRLKESLWCKKEIETFINLHGREKVFAVLIEGEPEESFPEELLYVEETVQKSDGTTETVRKSVEPLAADIRGRNQREMKKAMRTEILRLMAPMFSLGFDDLRQRHRERRLKKILAATAAGAAICLAFGAVSSAMAFRIQKQKEQIQAQNMEIYQQNMEIQMQNSSLLENQALNLAEESARKLEEGDRTGAVQTAFLALTEYEGIRMPYTAEAQLALTESLHVYDGGKNIKAMHQMETAGIIRTMLCSPDRRILVTYDASGTFTIWDIGTGTALDEIHNPRMTETLVFLGDDRLAYIDDVINIYSISDRAVTDTLDATDVDEIYTDKEGKYLLVREESKMTLYDAYSLKELLTYEKEDNSTKWYNIMFAGEDFLVFLEAQEDGKEELYFLSIIDNALSGPIPVEDYRIKDVEYRGDMAYLLLNYLGEDVWYYETMILACNPRTAEIKWQKIFEGGLGSYLFRPYAEGADKLLFATSDEIYLIGEKDGAEYARFPMGSSMAGGAVFANLDRYIVFTRSGEYHLIDVGTKMDYLMDYRFLCHSQNVMKFMVLTDGFLVLPYQDNKVTFYNYSQGGELEENSDELLFPETVCLDYSEAVSFAQEKGLPKAELVSCVFFNTDESLAFVYHTDATLEIYDTSDMSLKRSLTGVNDTVRQYLGADKDGNLFVGGSNYGYMLSPDLELIGIIEGLAAVEQGGSRLYIQPGSGEQYAVPIYTLEELLAKAEAFVIR